VGTRFSGSTGPGQPEKTGLTARNRPHIFRFNREKPELFNRVPIPDYDGILEIRVMFFKCLIDIRAVNKSEFVTNFETNFFIQRLREKKTEKIRRRILTNFWRTFGDLFFSFLLAKKVTS